MSKDAFTKLEKEQIENALARINPLIDGSAYNIDTVTILARAVSFYPDHDLLDIADYETVPVRRNFAVSGPSVTVVLDTTNAPIYQLNEEVPIKLTRQNVADYIRFFFKHSIGQVGRLQIVETVEDINWVEDPPPAVRKAIGEAIEPMTLLKSESNDVYRLRLCAVYRNALLAIDTLVDSDGTISIENESLLSEDLPVVDDILAQ